VGITTGNERRVKKKANGAIGVHTDVTVVQRAFVRELYKVRFFPFQVARVGVRHDSMIQC